MRIPKFYYKDRPARPLPPDRIDLETGHTVIYTKFSALWEEYMELKDLSERLLNEQLGKVEELLIELKQIKLHLASLSDAAIDEEDVD